MTIAHNRACSPFASGLPTIDHGSPGRALTSILGILRRPAVDFARLPTEIRMSLSIKRPGELREIYINDVHFVRTVAGIRFYIVPLADASGLKPVSGVCQARQIATLKRELAHTPTASRARILALQSQYLAWERYGELHPQGIAEAELQPGHDHGYGRRFGCCDTVPDIENGEAGLGFIGGVSRLRRRAGRPLAHADDTLYLTGIVPDGVATVTLNRTANPSYTTTAKVINNVWVARLPVKTVDGTFPLQYVWRSARGTLIKTIG